MMAKFTLTAEASVTLLVPPFLIEITQEPVEVEVTEADNELSPSCKDTTTTSFASIAVLIKVKLTVGFAGVVPTKGERNV